MPRLSFRRGVAFNRSVSRAVALVSAALLVPCGTAGRAQTAQQPPAAAAEPAAPTIPADQLDSLVAPIALYPDPLLSQTLVASTYPLEIMQLQQWLARNPTLKDKALTDAALQQPWDASIQAMVVLPDVVKRLADDIQWTTDLGNAFLAQQSDVMDAVQRMRAKAQGTGALTSSEQQTVETKVVENKTVIVVEPASPEIVYVPSYSPVVVYGPPVYPYPPIYYPAYTCRRRGREQHDLVRRRRRRGCGVGRRRMGLGLRVGEQRHRHQREQQLRPEHQHQQEYERQRQPRCPTTSGSTTRGIGVARRTPTGPRPIGMAEPRAATRWQHASRAPGRRRGVERPGNRRVPALEVRVLARAASGQTAAAAETGSVAVRCHPAPGRGAAARSAAVPGEGVTPGPAAAVALTAREALAAVAVAAAVAAAVAGGER